MNKFSLILILWKHVVIEQKVRGCAEYHFLLYSVNLTEYVAMDPRVCVCLCVCLSVCVCHLYSPNGWTDFDETFHKSFTMNLLNTFFSDFENSNLMTSWRPLLLFSVRALSRSQFCSDFLQSLGRLSKSQPTVCYLKSAKSVDNFGSYG